MSARVVVYLPRMNQLKALAPVIDRMVHGNQQAFEVTVVVPGWAVSKHALRPDADQLRTLFQDRVRVIVPEDPSGLIGTLQTGGFDAFVNLMPYVHDLDRATVKTMRTISLRMGTKWVALPYLYLQDFFVVQEPRTMVETWDLICTVGPRSMRYIETRLKGLPSTLMQALRARLRITGYPELDGLASFPEPSAIRAKYGLPAEKPVVYVSTAPAFYRSLDTGLASYGLECRFRREWDLSLRGAAALAASLRYPTCVPYHQYLRAIREFADVNGACVVAKTRAKHYDPPYLWEYADLVIGDRSYYPFTTLELLRVSSLYLGFYSASAVEAVAIGRYAMSFLFVPAAVMQQADWYDWSQWFEIGPGALWNMPGVSEIVEGTRRSGFAALERLRRSRLDAYQVDETHRQRLVQDYLSFIGTSSQQCVEAVLACLASKDKAGVEVAVS